MTKPVTPVQIGRALIGPGQPVMVVAEIGANFASPVEGRAMITAAAAAGCDAVKVQTFRADTLVRAGAMFTFEDGSHASQHDFFRARELSADLHRNLKAHAEAHGLLFFSTPSHLDDLALLEELEVAVHKIGSDDLTNLPFIRRVAETGRPVILSTGMSTLEEIGDAVECVHVTGNARLVLLHCLVGYPAPAEDVHLRVIGTLAETFGVPVGFSDHTTGILASTLAVALGACLVEKHFTLDRSAGGPDNDTSLEPEEMAAMVRDIRAVPRMLGQAVKRVQPGEEKWRAAARKSLVAARHVRAGERITEAMIAIKRPADGLPPRHLPDVVGRTAVVDIPVDTALSWSMIQTTR